MTSSNLTNHAKKHKSLYAQYEQGNAEVRRTSIQQEITLRKVAKFDLEKSSEFLVQWIISDSQAFKVAESPFFEKFLESLNVDYQAIKKDAVTQRTMNLFEIVKQKIIESLNNHPNKFSLTLDIWTSPSQDPFLCVTLHSIDENWILKTQVLAFRHIPGKHTGANMALVLQTILKEYKIEDRILTITMDNASNNDKLVDELIKKGILFDPENHIRCFAHIVNLAAQDCIYEFGDKLKNLRGLVTAIRYSPQKLERLRAKRASLSVPFLKPKLDVTTRWNSTST